MRRGVVPDDVDDLIQTIFMEVHRNLCKPVEDVCEMFGISRTNADTIKK